MKGSEAEFPVVFTDAAASVRELVWAGMKVSHVRAKAGARAPLRSVSGACPHEHWGYVLYGKLQLRFGEGREEVIAAGETFYLPPGHAGVFLEDTYYLEFTPVSTPR